MSFISTPEMLIYYLLLFILKLYQTSHHFESGFIVETNGAADWNPVCKTILTRMLFQTVSADIKRCVYMYICIQYTCVYICI